MTFTVSVTFEYETRQPDTAKVSIDAGSYATAIRRAVQVAQKQLKPSHWRSIVVLMER